MASVEVRPASTVIVVRERVVDEASFDQGAKLLSEPGTTTCASSALSQAGIEVLLVRRTQEAAFAPGVYVFPGGKVEDVDRNPRLYELASGLDDWSASARLGVERDGLAYWIAATRECLEEAGILYATPDPSDAQVQIARQALARGEGFEKVLRELGLQLAVSQLHYFSHWITPPGPPRRFDTRFFVAPVPRSAAASHDEAEVVAHEWVEVKEALERQRKGELSLIFPTIRNLEALARFSSLQELLDALSVVESAPGGTVTMVPDAHAKRVILPGDDGFEELSALVAPAPIVYRRPVQLAPGVQRLTAHNPSVMTAQGTNTYILGLHPPYWVVDPGPEDPTHLRDILDATKGQVEKILVTHHHEDHAPGAVPLARETGAAILGWGHSSGFRPDHSLGDGELLEASGLRLRVLHTPGHASDHLCFWLLDLGWLLAGDHLMTATTVVIPPPDGDMAAYLASLERLEELSRFVAVLPGHGELIRDPLLVIRGVLSHRLEREAKVLAALEDQGTATVDELAPFVYDDVSLELVPIARYSLWAHLRKLASEARIEVEGGPPGDLQARWRALAGR
jgi:glyoxylase-like metal-dependent hydrolase (beta-lactamase superfamily II)/8-oxo-dGTP pyrophosphatase MutT (NUDIX family)